MVGGLENAGDSITVKFDIPEDDYYDLSVIFGNSNEGVSADTAFFDACLILSYVFAE